MKLNDNTKDTSKSRGGCSGDPGDPHSGEADTTNSFINIKNEFNKFIKIKSQS